MAQNLDASGGSLLVTLGGWAVAILVALFTFIVQWRKGGVDETAMVLGKWKELVDAHEGQISGMRAEIERLQQRVTELENISRERGETIHQLEMDNRRLEDELAGERRQRAQQAESFREQLKRLGHNNVEGLRDEPSSK